MKHAQDKSIGWRIKSSYNSSFAHQQELINFETMKPIAFILSIMILALSFVPCADKESFGNFSKEKTILIEKHNSPFDTDRLDDCSPFCTCNCCAGFSINHVIASVSNNSFGINSKFSSYLPVGITEVSLPVWQPPQLS